MKPLCFINNCQFSLFYTKMVQTHVKYMRTRVQNDDIHSLLWWNVHPCQFQWSLCAFTMWYGQAVMTAPSVTGSIHRCFHWWSWSIDINMPCTPVTNQWLQTLHLLTRNRYLMSGHKLVYIACPDTVCNHNIFEWLCISYSLAERCAHKGIIENHWGPVWKVTFVF